MPDESLEVAIQLPEGFPINDIELLGRRLAEADPFVSAFEPPEFGLYSLPGQVWALQVERLETILIPDRNVASRMAQIAMGNAIGKDAQIIAGIKAFTHFFDIFIEPSIAFHELAHVQGNEIANQELAWFRAADHGDKFDWLEVALGRADRLKRPAQPHAIEVHDLATRLRDWSTAYGALLKVSEIELSSGTSYEKIMALLEWLHSSYFYTGQVAVMACIYFAPISPPKAGLLKGLRSPSRERAIEGVQNAAWDALYLSSLVASVNKAAGGSKRYLYASLDARARLIARIVLAFGVDGPNRGVMASHLAAWWPTGQADAIADKLTAIALDIGRPEMDAKLRNASATKPETIALGEQFLRKWRA